MYNNTIFAVIATYNRRDSLGRCLEALLTQTHPLDAVCIVDNASTDGTFDFLKERGWVGDVASPATHIVESVRHVQLPVGKKQAIHYVTMPENTGGAGAFHEGLKRGYEKGYDWLWLLDDDGLPDIDALEKLLDAAERGQGFVYNCLTIASDRENLAIPCVIYHGETRADGWKMARTLSEIKDCGIVLNGQANFFNGSLIHRAVIDKVGLPDKGFFIWGDEVEYTMRIQDAGLKTHTVRNSFLVHPYQKPRTLRCFGRTMRFIPLPPWKLYYSVRNSLYIDRKYKLSRYPHLRFVCKVLKNLVVALVFGKDKLKAVRCLMMAFKDGLLGRIYVNTKVI